MSLKNEFKRLKQWTKTNIKVWGDLPLKNKFLITVLNSVFPLLIGLLVYLFFVPTSHISNAIYYLLGTSFAIRKINLNGSFVTCYLADFLWAYSLMAVVVFLIVENGRGVYKAFGICCCFEIVIENLQRTPIIDGTFDIYDIFIELLANVIAFLVIIFGHNFARAGHH